MSALHASARPWPECPLVVAYGLGVDSTAMLVEFAARGIKPDLILFADTGGEKPETYEYLGVIRPFLAGVGFPDVLVVRYRPRRAVYHTLEGQCLHTGTLPSLAYGGKSCSIKYKKTPQDRFVAGWGPARRCWARGGKVLKAIGFDAGPADSRRHRYAEDDRYRYWYPLVEWGHDRDRCKEVIVAAGLPVPMKSACFFCPASKKQEVVWLREHHPDLLERALRIEDNAQASLTSVKGLGRSYSWRSFLSRIDDLPCSAAASPEPQVAAPLLTLPSGSHQHRCEVLMIPDLPSYRWVVLNSSAGKDSQAMLDLVVEQCDRSKVPRDRLVVAHADLGRVEWPGTRELAEEQARHYGLAFHAVTRPQGDLLGHIEARGMFPSPTARFCTSDHLCCQPHNMSYVARLVMWCRAGWHRIRTVFLWTIPTARLSSC